MAQIYKVTTEGDVEGITTKVLGYASGSHDDIMKYYDDKKMYYLRLEQISII